MPTFLQVTLPIEPPEPIGNAKGVHVYLEFPDQSSGQASFMDGTTDMSGSFDMSGTWALMDIGTFPYTGTGGAQQIQFTCPNIVPDEVGSGANARIYAVSYSDTVDPPPVQANQLGASPNVLLAINPPNAVKPGAGSNVTPIQVYGVTASVGSNVNISGKVQTEISVVVDLTGVPSPPPADWGFQIQGYINGDLSTPVALLSGVYNTAGLVPATPDNDPNSHTFLYDTPTTNQIIVCYAVAGRVLTSIQGRAGIGIRTSSQFQANTIVPGVTPSSTITVGIGTGTLDLTQAVQSRLDASVGNRTGATFGVLDLGVQTSMLQDLLVTTAKLASAAVTDAKVLSISAVKITAGTLAAGVIYGGQINASQINAGTINVAITLTAPTIQVTSGSVTINLDATNFVLVTNTSTTAFAQMLYTGFQVRSTTSGAGSGIGPGGFAMNNSPGGATTTALGNTFLQVQTLPSSSPGAGSKQFWYDPADSNRVKYAV